MIEAGIASLDEMSAINVPPIDLSDYATMAKDQVRGQDFPDVLRYFVRVSAHINKEKMEEEASENVARCSPISNNSLPWAKLSCITLNAALAIANSASI